MMRSSFRSRRELLATIPFGLAAVWMLGTPGAAVSSGRINKTPAEWMRELGPARFQILRSAGTEPPFSSPLNREHRQGMFACAGCALPLFSSSTKFDSGTGWPSFTTCIAGALETKVDRKLFVSRTEYHCARCGGHQGHVFEDGPKPTGQRWCNNGVALMFVPDPQA